MIVYKGFNADMTCTPNGKKFQFAEGESYHEDKAKLCERGFHACEMPLDCLRYYPPATSVYHVCELEGVTGEKEDDTKVCGTDIKIGARLDIAGFVKAQIDWVQSKTVQGKNSRKDLGAASATGYQGAASATGYQGAASATGNRGAASATGNRGAASATGYQGAASATGYQGAASATGDQGAASATGYLGAASATGYRGAASATGKASAAMAVGRRGRVMGALGCALFCVERGEWDGETYPIKSVCAGIVDGETLLPGVWYMCADGKFVEVKDE